jgi:hypothetical protein
MEFPPVLSTNKVKHELLVIFRQEEDMQVVYYDIPSNSSTFALFSRNEESGIVSSRMSQDLTWSRAYLFRRDPLHVDKFIRKLWFPDKCIRLDVKNSELRDMPILIAKCGSDWTIPEGGMSYSFDADGIMWTRFQSKVLKDVTFQLGYDNEGYEKYCNMNFDTNTWRYLMELM